MKAKVLRTSFTVLAGLALTLSSQAFAIKSQDASSNNQKEQATLNDNQPKEIRVVGVLDRVVELLEEFYPKAKVTRDNSSLHVEYKSKKILTHNSRKKKSIPNHGGIVFDIKEVSGKYPGKEYLPLQTNEILYVSLLMAPYSELDDKHLLTKVLFPETASVEFLQKFKEIISEYKSSKAPEKSVKAAESDEAANENQTNVGKTSEEPKEDKPASLESAMQKFNAGQYKPALDEFRKLPQNEETHYYQGLCFQKLAINRRALEEFTWVHYYGKDSKMKANSLSYIQNLQVALRKPRKKKRKRHCGPIGTIGGNQKIDKDKWVPEWGQVDGTSYMYPRGCTTMAQKSAYDMQMRGKFAATKRLKTKQAILRKRKPLKRGRPMYGGQTMQQRNQEIRNKMQGQAFRSSQRARERSNAGKNYKLID